MKPAEISTMLNLSAQVLAKYTRVLESKSYIVERNALNHREYQPHDIAILKCMLHMVKERASTIEEAADIVSSSDFDAGHYLRTYGLIEDDVTLHNVVHNGESNIVRDVMTLQSNGERNGVMDSVMMGKVMELVSQSNEMVNVVSRNVGEMNDEVGELRNEVRELKSMNAKLMESLRQQSETMKRQSEMLERLSDDESKSFFERLFGKR